MQTKKIVTIQTSFDKMTYDVVKRQGLFVFGQINMMRITITTGIKHIDMDQRVII